MDSRQSVEEVQSAIENGWLDGRLERLKEHTGKGTYEVIDTRRATEAAEM